MGVENRKDVDFAPADALRLGRVVADGLDWEQMRKVAGIDTQGDVHPTQFCQDPRLGNLKTTPFSEL